jgi:hypothetical protein
MRIHPSLAVVVLMVAVSSNGAAQASTMVPYPDGYRSWTHVKSMVLFEDHALADPFEGMHHIYANAAAMAGLQSGSYSDDAIFVFDLLGAIRADGVLVEGDRKRIDVMHRDTSRHPSTGGWGYVTFVGNSHTERLDQDVATGCYACHQSLANQAYVFSRWRP